LYSFCKTKLPIIIEKYAERDIFDDDKTWLFYRSIPNETMAFKMKSGGKVSKERLTVFLFCYIIGEFERPLIIGYTNEYEVSKQLDVNTFPIDCYWNKYTWMTTQIIQSRLK